jgi:hypothetical protein
MSNKPKIGHRPGRCEPLAPAKCLHRHACLPASLPPPTLNFTRLPLAYPSCAPGPRRAPPPRWFRSCARTLRSCRVGSRRPPRVAHHRGLHRLALRRLRRGHHRDLGHARTVHGQGTVSVRSTHDRERPSNRTIRSTPGVQAGRRTMHFWCILLQAGKRTDTGSFRFSSVLQRPLLAPSRSCATVEPAALGSSVRSPIRAGLTRRRVIPYQWSRCTTSSNGRRLSRASGRSGPSAG